MLEQISTLLLNPNVAYLLLWAGLTMALLATLSPGTGILEIGALISLILAGYAVYNLPVNYWALGLLLLGMFFFILAIRYAEQWYFLAISMALLVVGSIFLFREENWWDPAVNPFLALTVSGLSSAFFWVATRKVLEARQVRPSHDMKSLVGEVGEAKTGIYHDGSVQVGSELWSATSEETIRIGSKVRILEVDGFTVVVEAIDENDI